LSAWREPPHSRQRRKPNGTKRMKRREEIAGRGMPGGARLVGRTVCFIRKVDARRPARCAKERNRRQIEAKLSAAAGTFDSPRRKKTTFRPADRGSLSTRPRLLFESSKFGRGESAVVRGATTIQPATAFVRQSLPQPIHRTARRSRPARKWQLFSQTRGSVSAKNHLGPPQ
jgi:hypothetical protein